MMHIAGGIVLGWLAVAVLAELAGKESAWFLPVLAGVLALAFI